MNFQDGDLLFLDLNEGELSDAIANVTKRQWNVVGPSLSHVGWIVKENEQVSVVEAWKQVQKVSLDHFLARAKKESKTTLGWYWGRLIEPHQHLISRCRSLMERHMGVDYDNSFRADSNRFYCSHLIAETLREANEGKPLFDYRPMYFGEANDPADEDFKMWVQHFKQRKEEMPIGLPGVSPLSMYLSPSITKLR